MTRLVAASGAFLLGVLWMDLMSDVQVRSFAQGPLHRGRSGGIFQA